MTNLVILPVRLCYNVFDFRRDERMNETFSKIKEKAKAAFGFLTHNKTKKAHVLHIKLYGTYY